MWHRLHDLELLGANPQAAAQARQQAIQSYLAYRWDGGEPQTLGGDLCKMITHAIQQGETATVEQALAQSADPDDPPTFTLLLAKLHAILTGDRNPALANDPELYYQDVAELQLLLERLRGTGYRL